MPDKEKTASVGEAASYNKHIDYSVYQRDFNSGKRSYVMDCPCCGYKGAMSVTRKDGCTLYYCHAGCSQPDLLKVIRGVQHDWTPIYERRPQAKKAGLQEYIFRLWQSSILATGTLAETYLIGRGITTPISASIRFLPRHKHKDNNDETFWPVMLAGIADYTGKLQALHRTYLTSEGRKAPVKPSKMTLGPVGGYAVHLATAGEIMAVSEGIETGFSFMEATGLPTWAAVSAGGIIKLNLPPLPLAREVIIAADNDENGVGQRAAEAAAVRWLAEGRKVKIALPPEVGTDFNDMLVEGVQ